jgi:hypothetical protein
VVVAIMIAIVIAIVVTMAALAGFLEFVAPPLGLAAVVAMPADGLLQIVFGFPNLIFTSPVVTVPIQSARGYGSGEEH